MSTRREGQRRRCRLIHGLLDLAHRDIGRYAAVRHEVKLGAGEDVDFKQYEAGMRFLLDTYIQAANGL